MCNIAGYAGKRRAAPILIEMLRRQEQYDGGGGAGIATVHNGTLYMRKAVGSVDDLVRTTDAADLPGTAGIIHTRPGGSPSGFIHPHISEDGRLAMVQNGDVFLDKYHPMRSAAAERVRELGYRYVTGAMGNSAYPHLADGTNVPIAEATAHLVSAYRESGLGYSDALARASEDEFAQMVSVMLCANEPDVIRAVRITSAMNALVGDGESFIATCPYAFDREDADRCFMLPELSVCEIRADGVKITASRVSTEPIEKPSARTYAAALTYTEQLLRDAKEIGGVYFTDIELMLRDHKDELFTEGYTYTQHARVGYDVVRALDKEGKIKSELRMNPLGTRKLRYMWIE